MARDNTFWQAQLDAHYAEATALSAAILALTTGGAIEYELDTGQSSQKVRRSDLTQMRLRQNNLLGQISTLEGRLGGCNTTHVTVC